METTKDNIAYLLEYCSKCPEIYNDVASHLWKRFHIVSAEIVLLVTYYVAEERRSNGKNSTSNL